MHKQLFIIMIILFVVTQVAWADSYLIMDEPDLNDAVFLVTDLYSTGQKDLIVGQKQRVYLASSGNEKILLEDISGDISAIAMGDLKGNLRNNLVVGTADVGGIYSYTNKNGIWEREGQPHYVWNTINKIQVADFNNDGWGDLAILTEQGQLQIWLSFEGELYPFWKSSPEQVVIDFAVLDENRSGSADLIYALRQGYVGILTWDDQEFVTLWENYPWGLIESLVVLPGQSEWLVVTSQKMLYGWRQQNGQIEASRHFSVSDLGEYLFYIPNQGLLSFSAKHGARLFELKANSVAEKWRVPGAFGNRAIYYQGQYYFSDHEGKTYQLVSDSGNWRLFLQDQDITGKLKVLEQEKALYYNLQDLALLLDYEFFSLESWRFLNQERYLEFSPRYGLVNYADLLIPLEDPLLWIEGEPYGTVEVLTYFGWTATVDHARKRINLEKNWGWWL